MNAYSALVVSPALDRLAWTLLHFLWQGALIAAVYVPVRFTLQRTSARVRYGMACAFLAVLVAAPLVTWSVLASSLLAPAAGKIVASGSSTRVASYHPVLGFTAPAADVTAQMHFAAKYFNIPLPYPLPAGLPAGLSAGMVALWLLGVAILALRGMRGWLWASRLPQLHSRPAPPHWQQRFETLARRMGRARPVRFLISAAVPVPVVVGWLRPAILMPVSALAGLPPEQFESILAHELAHVLRHDYLVNLLQGAAETLLFYHPAVWWISGQVRAERENCCDDLAVAASGDALVYANALFALETRRPARHQPLLAATGGALLQRIARLIAPPPRERRAAPVSAPIFAALVVAMAATASLAVMHRAEAQTAPLPRFDVASIKLHERSPGIHTSGISVQNHGRMSATGASLQWLITSAYNVQDYQLIGAPDWMTTERWDIEAHGDANAKAAQVELMLRALIEDRFQFRYHLETRQLPVYVLKPGKNGSRLPPPDPAKCKGPDGEPEHAPFSVIHPLPTSMTAIGCAAPMKDLIDILEMSVHRPVSDQTGATAPFDFNMTFANENQAAAASNSAAPSDPAPSLSTTLAETLGLRLESTKGPVQVIVIDHVAQPTPN